MGGVDGLRREGHACRLAAADLAPATESTQRFVVLGAAWLGKARLIDNLPVGLGAGRRSQSAGAGVQRTDRA